MHYIVTADQMRSMDAETIEDIGIPGAVLMETAGRRVAESVLDELTGGPGRRRGRVAVVCGAGNNGGDGYVVARVLREHGVDAAVLLACPRDKLRGDAAIHFAAYERCGGVVIPIADADSLAHGGDAIETADVVVDAVFGTGLARAVGGHYRAVIDAINRTGGRVVAVDIPSGLSADTGAVLGACVRADRTVTMAFLKVGLAVSPGYARCGAVSVAEIGIPAELAIRKGIQLAMLERTDVFAMLPVLHALDHKGRRGHLLAIAGSPGRRGAARLTSMAGLRAGAGLVTLAAAGGGRELIAPDPVMTAELDADDRGCGDTLVSLSRGKHALAIGPGMPVGDGGQRLVRDALARVALPMVIDADGLNHLVGDLDAVASAQAPIVLTPHPGEAGRLLGVSSAEIEADRVAAVRRLASRCKAVTVLKGARTLVCDEAGFTTVNPSGNPGLATAGSGDVLTGIIGALLAQGLAPAVAARAGVYVHGVAGDRAANRLGGWGVTASEVLAETGPALRDCAADANSL